MTGTPTKYDDAEVCYINLRTLNAGHGKYGIGAELRVAGELIKICSLYVTDIATKTDGVIYGCGVALGQVPASIKLVIFRSNERCFNDPKRMQRKIGVLHAGKFDEVLFFHRDYLKKEVYWLAEDGLHRKSDCISDI